MTVQDRVPERVGPYRLLRRLGEGGMGVVYLASDAAGQLVAVKALRPAVAADPTSRRRLAREVEMMRRVRSPFVAEIIDADVNAEPPYIVTRHVPGATLDEVVSGQGPLTGTSLARLASGLAAALAAVHAAGVVHRDLKPGNVMILNGHPVVIDFGIAQAPESTRITMTGMFMGTPGYLAPEVIEGSPSGPAADIHSWGATVAFAATGKPPFGSGAFEAIFYRIVHGEPDLSRLPPPLVPLVRRALARDPGQRPPAAELGAGVAALDPAGLVPRTLPAGWAGAPRPAAAPALPARVPAYRPLPSPADFRGMLPPADYASPGYASPDRYACPAGDGSPAGYASPAPVAATDWAPGAPAERRRGSPDDSPAGPAAPAAPATPARPRSPWSPLVLAVVTGAIAISVLRPVAGGLVMLAGLIALRAGDLTGSRLARRRARPGSGGHGGNGAGTAGTGGGGGALAGTLYFPVALARTALRFLLLSPLGLILAAVVAALTLVLASVHPVTRAAGYAAGALIAFYGLGPGSGAARRPLGALLGRATRSPGTAVLTGILVFALACVLAVAAVRTGPVFWPARPFGHAGRLPGLHSVLYDVRGILLRQATRIGL